MGLLLNLFTVILAMGVVAGAKKAILQSVRTLNSTSNGNVESVGTLATDALHVWASECHLVLVRTSESQVSAALARLNTELFTAVLTIDVGSDTFPYLKDDLFRNLWGRATSPCRALVLDLTGGVKLIYRFLVKSQVFLYPDMRVVMLGREEEMEDALQHSSLRNTIHVVYLAIKGGLGQPLEVYRRCLYCNYGYQGILPVDQWQPNLDPSHIPDLFSEKIGDFMGHKFNVVSRFYFPTIDYTRDTEENGTTVTLVDSLNARMLLAFAAKLNFTYVIREPKDREWGALTEGGMWTGLVGTLQREEADFSTTITPTAPRLLVMDHSRIYTRDPFVIVSLKPRKLPQYLALVTPFTGTVWLVLIVTVFGTGISLFLLLWVWSKLSGEVGDYGFSTSLFFAWGTMLEDPPFTPPRNVTGRMVVMFMAVLSVVMCSGYRSSLVAHLTVQLREPAINTFGDLVRRSGWRWGSELLQGASKSFFELSTDPNIQEVFRRMETHDLDEQMALVLKGGYSFITTKFQNTAVVALQYTDARGFTPVHISNVEYPKFAGTSFGFRRGAPFRWQFAKAKQQLIEGGFIDYWLRDVVYVRGKEERKNPDKDKPNDRTWDANSEDDGGQVVLKVSHLQSGFYLLFLGHILALLAFVGEKLYFRYQSQDRRITHP